MIDPIFTKNEVHISNYKNNLDTFNHTNNALLAELIITTNNEYEL